jgi:S-formylglutathione hydrolase FrmB
VYVAAQRGIRWLFTDELGFTVLLTHTAALGKWLWSARNASNDAAEQVSTSQKKSTSSKSSASITSSTVPITPKTLLTSQYERNRARAELIKGGYSSVIPTANTTVIDFCLRVDNATQQFLTEHNIPVEHIAQKGRAGVILHFNRALTPHKKDTDVVVIWIDDDSFDFYSNTTEADQRHEELSYAMATNSSFMAEHKWMGVMLLLC